MSLGRPVFLSHATSLPEVAGPLGFYWYDFSPDHMLDVFQRGQDVARRDAAFGDKLRAHAGQFTWERSAQRYLDLYRRVAAECAPNRRAA
jgi:glycogen synthase